MSEITEADDIDADLIACFLDALGCREDFVAERIAAAEQRLAARED